MFLSIVLTRVDIFARLHFTKLSLLRSSLLANHGSVVTLRGQIATLKCGAKKSPFSDGDMKRRLKSQFSARGITERTSNCSEYFRLWEGTAVESTHPSAKCDYPLAFSHSVHKDPAIFELYMALHSRKCDTHCVHIDKKAPESVRGDFTLFQLVSYRVN